MIGAVDDQDTVKSPTTVAPSEKKSKKDEPSTSKSTKPVRSKSDTDNKIAKLDQKFSDRFNHLEALLLARSFEPTSSNVKVTPTHSPPAGVVQGIEPFIRPAQLASASTTDFLGSGFSASQHQLTSKEHVQGRTYQFKALPFGLSTAPMEFTVVAKEVKLMAIHKGIRIHQYLDNWLVRARSHQICLQHKQDLVKMCQQLGWLEKSELEPREVFNFVG